MKVNISSYLYHWLNCIFRRAKVMAWIIEIQRKSNFMSRYLPPFGLFIIQIKYENVRCSSACFWRCCFFFSLSFGGLWNFKAKYNCIFPIWSFLVARAWYFFLIEPHKTYFMKLFSHEHHKTRAIERTMVKKNRSNFYECEKYSVFISDSTLLFSQRSVCCKPVV